MSFRPTRAAIAFVAACATLLAACGVTTPRSEPAPSAAATSSAPVAKPTVAQPQLPLPTNVRWLTDKGSPDDPAQRSLLVLLYDGYAQGWQILDATGAVLFRVPIAGSGVFGPDTCLVKTRSSPENATWLALDQMALARFVREYRGYRAVAEGIPASSVTLELVDSGCRGT